MLLKQMPCFTPHWFQWVFQSFHRVEGAAEYKLGRELSNSLYDADLLHLAAFQGSKKVVVGEPRSPFGYQAQVSWSGSSCRCCCRRSH
ncbi:hypothetical protein HOP50_14g72600 [Chloropicon primus]|nr:hypothetical protein HOP50_14g72600 [Chloropicon primus]